MHALLQHVSKNRMDLQEFLSAQFDKFSSQISSFEKLDSNYARIEYLIDHNKPIIEKLSSYLDKIHHESDTSCRKSIQISEAHRQRGNEHFSKKNYKQALKFYNLALLNASRESKSLLLSYSNRSAVFYNENLFNECLIDIESAKNQLESFISSSNIDKKTLSDLYNLAFKLLNREINCLVKTNQTSLDFDSFVNANKLTWILNQSIFSEFKDQTSSQIKQLENVYQVKKDLKSQVNEAGSIESISNYINPVVEIKYTNDKGRHCVTKETVSKGQVLFVEKPYSSVILPEFNLDYCQQCYKQIYSHEIDSFLPSNIEACSDCNEIFYCSNKCKSEAASVDGFHRHECGFLQPLLLNVGIAHLAYRIVVSTRPSVIRKYAEIDKKKEQVNLMSIDYTTETSDQDYEQVFHLLTHEKETHVEDLFKYSLTSILLAIKYSNKSDDLKPSACLILRHLMQTICNAHAITQLKDQTESRDQRRTLDRDQVRFATAIYPRVSLLNHSCDPNVVSSFKTDSNVIVVKAGREIEKAGEIFNCYGPHHVKMSLSERQQSLWEQYRFKCECTACERQKSSTGLTGLKCLKCKSSITQSDNREITCKACSNTTPLSEYVRLVDNLIIQMDYLLSDMHKIPQRDLVKKTLSLITDFKVYLAVGNQDQLDLASINDNFKPFYLRYSKLVDFLARNYCDLSLFDKAAGLIEENIRLLQGLYNFKDGRSDQEEYGIEIAHELFKLAEIQCNCQRFSHALVNVNKAIEIASSFYSGDNKVLQEFNQLKSDILSILQ